MLTNHSLWQHLDGSHHDDHDVPDMDSHHYGVELDVVVVVVVVFDSGKILFSMKAMIHGKGNQMNTDVDDSGAASGDYHDENSDKR